MLYHYFGLVFAALLRDETRQNADISNSSKKLSCRVTEYFAKSLEVTQGHLK